MDDKIKSIGSPTSQGNIGPKYEDRVAAWCMAHVIAKEELNQIRGLPIEVGVQAKHVIPKLDDIVVYVRLNGEKRGVFVQSKLTLAFTAGDKEYAETLEAIRDRIESGASESETYVIAFQNNDNNNHRRVSELLLAAETAPDANEWVSRIGYSGPRFEALRTLRMILAGNGAQPGEALLFRVCRQTKLWRLSLMDASATDVDTAVLKLRDYVRGDADNRRLFWSGLVDLVAKITDGRGSRTRQDIVNAPGLRSLYKEPAQADPVANLMSEGWLAEKARRARELDDEVRAGRAYESLVEVEALLSDIERLRLLHPGDTPAARGLHALLCELKVAQGRALYAMNFASETPGWIQDAKDLGPTEALWMQIGRLAASVEDFASLEEACQNVRDVTDLTLLRIRVALMEGDELVAWSLVDAISSGGRREAFGIRASHLFENLNDDPGRLAQAISFADRYREASADRDLSTLLYASAVYMALVPNGSPLYLQGVAFPEKGLGAACQDALESLERLLAGDVGIFEKTVAFGLILPMLWTFRDPQAPHVKVLDDFPAFLARSTTFRTLGYAQAMYTIGKNDHARRALRQKLSVETDPELIDALRSMVETADGGVQRGPEDLAEHPWYYRGRIYSLMKEGKTEDAVPLARSLAGAVPALSCGAEAAFIQSLVEQDASLTDAAADLIERFPDAVETYNGLIDLLDRLLGERRGEAEQSIREFVEELEGDGHWDGARKSLFLFCGRLAGILPSVHCLSVWLNWSINLDDRAQTNAMVRSARSWGLHHLAAIGDAWLAAESGRFADVEALIAVYRDKYVLTPSIADFRDRSALQAGSYRTLVDRRIGLLDDKDRLPGTAKYTVHALILERMYDLAAETAKSNLDDFPDDRVALRDFIFAAVRLRRLDLAPDALQRFTSLYPDDPSLWTRHVEEGEGIFDVLPSKDDDRPARYGRVEIPLHFVGKPFPETWFQQLYRPEGLQARRLGLYGAECESLSEGATLFLDLTALLAASRYRLWDRLGRLRARTSLAAIASLRSHVRAMELQFNQTEFDKHAAYAKLLEKPNFKLYDELPEGARALIKKPTFTFGEGEVALNRWLGLPLIATHSHRETRTYTLQDVVHTIHATGRIRLFQKNAWLEKLRATRPDAYDGVPVLIEDPLDRIMIDDNDLRDVSEAGIADEFVSHFAEIVLGPTSSLNRTLLSMPHVWAEKAVRAATEYLAQVEDAIVTGLLETVEEDGLPDPDDAEFFEQMARISAQGEAFWCDDVVCRSWVAHEAGVRTVSTFQLIRLLKASGSMDGETYRDTLTLIGADGHRDIDGEDLLTSCSEDVGHRFTPELSRCAYHLGSNLRNDASRNDEEAEVVRRHVAYHLKAFAASLPNDKSDTLYETCLAMAAGAGVIGGRLFWPRVRNQISLSSHGDRSAHLSAIERAASEMGQLDLESVIGAEAAIRQHSNQPKLLSAPNFEEYMRFLRYARA